MRTRRAPTAGPRLAAMTVAAFLAASLSGCSRIRTSSPSPVAAVPSQASNKSSEAASRKLELAICLETAKLAAKRGMDEEAIAQYNAARRIDPAVRGIAHPLAVLYDRAGRTDAAEREYVAALGELGDEPDLLCDYGYFLYTTGRADEAEAKLQQALKKRPDHRQAKINLATVAGARGDYEQCRKLFAEAIGPAAALHNVGMLKLRAGDRSGAVADLEAASLRDPSLGETREVIASLRGGLF